MKIYSILEKVYDRRSRRLKVFFFLFVFFLSFSAKEGLHQNTFSPQLSLVTGNAPTLTINSFSPNSTGNVVPTTGVLLQEYQSPTGSTGTGCSVAVNGSSCPTSSTSSTMVVQGGNQVVQTTAKKREAFLSSQGQPVKLENKPTRQPCVCRNSNGKLSLRFFHSIFLSFYPSFFTFIFFILLYHRYVSRVLI